MIKMRDFLKMANGCTKTLANCFELLGTLLKHFGVDDDLKLKKVQENICKIDNILKLYNKKLGKFKSPSNFFTAQNATIQDWLNSEIEFSFFLSKSGAKKRSIVDVGKSSKYQKISDMKKLHSPASNLALSLSVLGENPSAVKDLSFIEPNSLTNHDCLGLMSYLHLSVNKYKSLRKFFVQRNINVLARYQDILDFKQSYIPNSLAITENSAIMPLSEVLKNSIINILNFEYINSSEEIRDFIFSCSSVRFFTRFVIFP